MPQVLTGLAIAGSLVVGLTALIAWCVSLVYGIKAIRCARPGVKLRSRETLWNPANVLLDSNKLTEDGLRYRRKCLVAVGVFVAVVGLPVLLFAFAGWFK